MMLFNLPSNILSTIYSMDSTYREKFKNEVLREMMKKTFIKRYGATGPTGPGSGSAGATGNTGIPPIGPRGNTW